MKKVENPNDAKTPKSFVIRTGKTMSDPTSSVLAQLVLDVRRIMEPNTATRLRVLHLQKADDGANCGRNDMETNSKTTSLWLGRWESLIFYCFLEQRLERI